MGLPVRGLVKGSLEGLQVDGLPAVLVLIRHELDILKDIAHGRSSKLHLRHHLHDVICGRGNTSDLWNSLLSHLAMTTDTNRLLHTARHLVMRVIAVIVAARIIVRIDHVRGLRANGRIHLLGGHRDVERVQRSLVVVRVAVVRVPVRALAVLAGLLLVEGVGAKEGAGEGDQDWKVHACGLDDWSGSGRGFA